MKAKNIVYKLLSRISVYITRGSFAHCSGVPYTNRLVYSLLTFAWDDLMYSLLIIKDISISPTQSLTSLNIWRILRLGKGLRSLL